MLRYIQAHIRSLKVYMCNNTIRTFIILYTQSRIRLAPIAQYAICNAFYRYIKNIKNLLEDPKQLV